MSLLTNPGSAFGEMFDSILSAPRRAEQLTRARVLDLLLKGTLGDRLEGLMGKLSQARLEADKVRREVDKLKDTMFWIHLEAERTALAELHRVCTKHFPNDMKHWSGSIVGFVDWKLGEYAKAPGSPNVEKEALDKIAEWQVDASDEELEKQREQDPVAEAYHDGRAEAFGDVLELFGYSGGRDDV